MSRTSRLFLGLLFLFHFFLMVRDLFLFALQFLLSYYFLLSSFLVLLGLGGWDENQRTKLCGSGANLGGDKSSGIADI